MTEKVEKTEQEWRAELTPEQYRILREHATEPAFTGEYYATKEPGVYLCAGCGAKLFGSDTKYDSGTGWPSFYEPADGEAVETERDWSLLVPRTEVHCASCGGHLGHVFSDGPDPTGLRYCINSAALQLERDDEVEPS
ncbi:MAG TPA: peptide-methionine (R)-S-oxide reductase MsrB [Gaiellaceae bacterium]|jgi:peptide-methionine (R)-S-oxide reductase|nr:peptide-methionine (R)-S-oxide reductase MsrB [Gaiellaceae bacterium]